MLFIIPIHIQNISAYEQRNQVNIVGRKKNKLTSLRRRQKQRGQTPLVLHEKILRQLVEIAWTRRNLLHRVFFFFCVSLEKPQEERSLYRRSQRRVLIPRFYQMNPHFFQILRVHCRELKPLASHQ